MRGGREGCEFSAELSRSLKILDRGRNIQKPVRNRSESVYAGLRAPTWALFGLVSSGLGPIWAQRRRLPAGFLEVVRDLLLSRDLVMATLGGETGFDAPVRFWGGFCAAAKGRPPNPVPKAPAGGEGPWGRGFGGRPWVAASQNWPQNQTRPSKLVSPLLRHHPCLTGRNKYRYCLYHRFRTNWPRTVF